MHEMALDDLVREPQALPETVVDSPLLRDLTGEGPEPMEGEQPSMDVPGPGVTEPDLGGMGSVSEPASDALPDSFSDLGAEPSNIPTIGVSETEAPTPEGTPGDVAVEAEAPTSVEIADETTAPEEEEPKSEDTSADQGIVGEDNV